MSNSPLLLDYHQRLPYERVLPCAPLLVSQGQWQGLVLERHDAPAWEMPEYHLSHHHLGILLDDWHGEQRVDGRHRTEPAPKGSFCLTPAQVPMASRWRGRSRAITLAIDPALLHRIAHEVVDRDRIELKFCMKHEGDLFIQQVLYLLNADAEAGYPIGPLYGESLGTALVAHLLKHYVTIPSVLPTYSGKMPSYRLNPVLDYISHHLHQPIYLEDLAAIAGMSQYYFCRMFRQTMGVTPLQYVRQKRIERAKELLKQRHITILEISLQCGFVSPSHFSRQFYQLVGVTPKAFRETYSR